LQRTNEIQRVYTEEIQPWLPEKIWDCHVHVTLKDHIGGVSPERYARIWALELGEEHSWEQLEHNQRQLFPNKEVHSLVFGNVYREVDIEANNDYVLTGSNDPANRSIPLVVTRPTWSGERVDSELERGFVGIKPYPDLVPLDHQEMSIFDFLPREHLAAVDAKGAVLMLHLPRAGRIADPENIRELRVISEDYPNARIIVAHVGRAFCLPTAERALPDLIDCPNLVFDIAANLNSEVMAYALDLLGPSRLLYGSDLPMAMMRGYREHVGEKYYNYTDLPCSWNTDRKPPEVEANYVYFGYEELRALIDALRMCGMDRPEMEQIVYSNTAGLVKEAL